MILLTKLMSTNVVANADHPSNRLKYQFSLSKCPSLQKTIRKSTYLKFEKYSLLRLYIFADRYMFTKSLNMTDKYIMDIIIIICICRTM